VEIIIQPADMTKPPQYFVRSLYDGQTREMLAYAKQEKGKWEGMVGDVEATSTLSIPKTHKLVQTSLSLKCKPTQRMF